MDALPNDIRALLSKVLPKIFITIDALISLRDVPVILEYMVLRLVLLEYAMYVWRKRQSQIIRGITQNSFARWQLLFSDRYLYFLFKDILLNCSNRPSESDNVHPNVKAARLRHDSGLGLYETAAAPARAVLRRILESSLRILIEDLVLSNVAKFGTWRDVRLLDVPQNKVAGLRGVEAQVGNYATDIWSFGCVLLESLTFLVKGTMPNWNATQSHPVARRTGDGTLVRKGSLLDRSIHRPPHITVRLQNGWISNTFPPIHWSSTSIYRPSKSNTFTVAHLSFPTAAIWVSLLKLHLSPTTRGKIATLLRSGCLQDLGLSIAVHTSREGRYVSLQSIRDHDIESISPHLRLANAGAIVDFIEIGDSHGLLPDASGGRLLPSHQHNNTAMFNWLRQFILIDSTEPLQRKIAARRLSISSVPFQASAFHHPTLLRQKTLSHSIVCAHCQAHRGFQDFSDLADDYVWDLSRRVSSGRVSIILSSGTGSSGHHSATFSRSTEILQFVLNAGADPVYQSARWLHLNHNLGSRQSVYAKPLRLDRLEFSRRNLISIRKAEEANAQIKKDHQSTVIGVYRNDMSDENFRSGKEQLRTKNIPRIAGSSETHNGATASSSPLCSMLRGLRDQCTTNFRGFWRRCFPGMPSRRKFNRLLRPQVSQDHVRLTWICHCGKELYGDFHNGDPSAVTRLVDRLQKRTPGIDRCSTTTLTPTTGHLNRTVMQSSTSSSSTSLASGMSAASSTPSHLSASSSQTSQTSINQVQPPQACHLKASGSTPSSSPGLVGAGYNPAPSTAHARTQKQYVEMCVNTGNHYQRLAEIDVARHKTDAELFRWIRKRYSELRGWRTKWQYFLRPQAMSYVEFALDRKQKVHIFRPEKAYPPQAEIDAGRYMYNMPPPPIPSNTFIHYLRECDLDSYSGSQDNEIWEIIAKKLDTRVTDHPSLSTRAYGMLVHEGPDVTAILWTMLVIVVVMCGPLIAFIVITKDVQSATGLAAAALAVVTLLWMGMQVDRGMNFAD